MRRRPINIFRIGIPRPYMSHTAHMFTSKNTLWRGLLAMKNAFCDHTCTKYYDGGKINFETKTFWGKWSLSRFNSMPLTCSWQENGHIFIFLPTCNRSVFSFCGIGLAFINIINSPRGFGLVLLALYAWHNLDPKYILTGISRYNKRACWPYIWTVLSRKQDESRNQKSILF